MPAIIIEALPALAAIGRQLVLAIVTTSLWQIASTLLQGVVEDFKQAIQDRFALSDDDARTVIANYLIDTAETAGILVAVLKSRLPVKTADYLGFSTKGWAKRALSAQGAAKVGGAVASTAVIDAQAPAALEAIATRIAAAKGVTFAQVRSVTTFVATLIGLPVGVFYAFAQYMDYAAWQNPYQHTMQNLLARVGINPDSPMPSANTLSNDSWKQIYSTIEELNPSSITMPVTQQNLVYSRTNLASAIDSIAAEIRRSGGSATVKNVLAIVFPLVRINPPATTTTSSTSAASTTAAASSGVTPVAAPSSQAQPVNIQVYTGVLAGGTLGVPQEFIAQPNPMIEDSDELKTAAQINLAAFVQSLPGRFFYELAIVNSVKTRAGFTQKGQAVKVISGYYKNGNPRYKTLYYKFAVMKLGVTDEYGRNVKLATINLGTVDVTTYQPTSADLSAINGSLTADTFTSDIGAIQTVVSPTPPASTNVVPPQNVVTPNPVTVPVPTNAIIPSGTITVPVPTNAIIPSAPAPVVATPAPVQYQPTSINLTPVGGNGSLVDPAAIPIGQFVGYSIPQNANFLYNGTVYTRSGNYVIRSPGTPTWAASPIENYRIPLSSSVVSVAPSSTKPGASASTLSEWYTANGQTLPSLQTRSLLYESAGLGPASTYVGSADQNNKLLGYLKSK